MKTIDLAHNSSSWNFQKGIANGEEKNDIEIVGVKGLINNGSRGMIIQLSVVLKRTAACSGDRRFDNLSGSHTSGFVGQRLW